MTEWRDWLRKIDFLLIVTAICLAAMSMIILYSIGSGSADAAAFGKKQMVWVAVGLLLTAVAGGVNYGRLKSYLPFIYGLNIFLLAFIFVAGKTALGAQRWIEIAGFRFQPSEFSKIFVIVTLAAFLAERKGQIEGWRDIALALVHVAPSVGLILLQPDLGTALVVAAILGGMLFAAGIKGRHILVLLILVYFAGAMVVKFNLLHDYQMKRLAVFLNPEVDPLGSGYNLRQSMIAIGSGGVAGKGLFSGTQSRLDFLPAAVRHTDFIFAVIGEELGFIGALLLIGLFMLLAARALRIASLARNHFGLLLAVGIVSMWTFQVLVNIGMTIGIMPVTGIPLPFVSYGGSSMLLNMASVGLLLSIFSRRWER